VRFFFFVVRRRQRRKQRRHGAGCRTFARRDLIAAEAGFGWLPAGALM
jgi:preprotein translocase subunit YajC